MFAQALAVYRRHFVALVLTAGLALLPASALVGGAWVMGLSAATEQEAGPPAGDENAPPRPAAGTLDPQRAPDAHQPEARRADSIQLQLSKLRPLALALLLGAGALLAATLLALAAVVPVVLGVASGPSQAWALVGARFGCLLATGTLSLALTLLGGCFLVVPGAVLAVGFAFAMPVAMVEGLRGHQALERSWMLMRTEWPSVLAVVVLYLAVLVAGSLGARALIGPGLGQLVGAAVLRMLLLPLAMVALVLLYLRARATVDCQCEQALRDQYIRRISAPG